MSVLNCKITALKHWWCNNRLLKTLADNEGKLYDSFEKQDLKMNLTL